MSKYAATTSVSVEKSKAEIEGTLTRYGADQFVSGWDQTSAKIAFRCNGRFVSFTLPIPRRDDEEFTTYMRGYSHHTRTRESALKQWEQACRQRWRALALCIKAKLEAVEAGITTFDDEFMAHIMLPNGGTVSQWMVPQLDAAYDGAQMPKALPGLLEAKS